MARCEECGNELPKECTDYTCDRCLTDQRNQKSPSFQEGISPTQATTIAQESWSGDIAELNKEFTKLEIVEKIGQGGMGVVYKARQRPIDRTLAVKILHPKYSNDPTIEKRFAREARVLAKLNHPNIVALYDFGRTPSGLCYFTMEFVDGLNLRSIMSDKGLEPATTLSIIPKICVALQYAHDNAIIHRDIKPENILINKQGDIKIADFGLGKILSGTNDNSHLTDEKKFFGTPHYMAPEQVENPRDVDHRADIFSLGVVFYEMLTGELPIGKFADPSKKVAVDERVDEIVLKTLEAQREHRYQHISQLKDRVRHISSTPHGKTKSSIPSESNRVRGKTSSKTEKPGASPRTRFDIAALVIILFLATGALYLLRPSPQTSVTSSPEIVSPEPLIQEIPTSIPTPIQFFPDPRLEAVVRGAIGIPVGKLTPENFVGIEFINLDASTTGITDLTGLEHLTDLRHLNIRGNDIEDLGPIASLTKLNYLWAARNQITDLSALTRLTSLKHLELCDNQLTSIDPIARATQLQFLDVSGNQIEDIDALSELVQLTSLNLSANLVTDITPLRKLVLLEQLSLTQNNVEDIAPLRNMNRLSELFLGQNNLTTVPKMPELKNLTNLELQHNYITDIDALAEFTKLRILHLSYNRVTNLNPVASLTNLEMLNLNHNYVTDIAALAENKDFGVGVSITLELNPLNQDALCRDIPALGERAEKVTYPLCGICGGPDTDGDGLQDSYEHNMGLDPEKVDSNDDGITDLDSLPLAAIR